MTDFLSNQNSPLYTQLFTDSSIKMCIAGFQISTVGHPDIGTGQQSQADEAILQEQQIQAYGAILQEQQMQADGAILQEQQIQTDWAIHQEQQIHSDAAMLQGAFCSQYHFRLLKWFSTSIRLISGSFIWKMQECMKFKE